MKRFHIIYSSQPSRDRSFMVRGVCQNDVLNPCWDNRPGDIAGRFWGDPEIASCPACAKLAETATK